MLTCTTCLRRALHSLTSDLPSTTLLSQSQVTISKAGLGQRSNGHHRLHRQIPTHSRCHATLASLNKGHHRRGLIKSSASRKPNTSLPGNKRRKAPWALTKVEIKDAKARDRNKAWLKNGDPKENEEEEEEEEGESNDNDVQDTRGLIRPSKLWEASDSQDRIADKLKQKIARQEQEERRLTRKDQKEVEVYFKDPLQLANGVLQRLRVPDIQGALRLVRASESFAVKNTVSWNHCMDWLMSQGDVKESLKVYNEMKKRGHMPDAHTYTIMLRGLSQHVAQPNTVQEAVKVYNSIFAPNSAVKPNTIHTNAIVNVCARGGDMDALWAVAGRLPDKGPGSPDRLTFTLILNAIRENTIRQAARTADKVNFGGDTEAAEAARTKMFEQAVADGRRLWEDISHRWRRADLVIDEQLVCAMGRLLLGCGLGKDIEQVLDLVDSTMNVRIGERTAKGTTSSPFASPSIAAPNGIHTATHDPKDSVEADESSSASNLPLKESNIYATPGQNTLSMLMEAATQNPGIRHLAPAYWRLLTKPNGAFKVKPDAQNILAYLRVLRVNRASSHVYDLLAHTWPQDVGKRLYRRATFIIAFATCARDKNNPNVFQTAQKLLDLMQQKLEESEVGMFDEGQAMSTMNYHQRQKALKKQKEELKKLDQEELAEHERQKDGVQSMPIDPKILQYFVQLALDTTTGWHEGLRGRDSGEIFERHPAKNHTMIALKTVAPHSSELKRLLKLKLDEMKYDDVPQRSRRSSLHREPRGTSSVGEKVEELMDLMRVMIGAYDKMIDMADRFMKARKEPIDANLIESYNARKREYTAYMARIEKTMATKIRNSRAYADENEEAEETSEADVEDTKPDIERRIKAVLEGVDSKIVQDRQEKKGYRNSFFPRGDDVPPLKMHSRKQKSERVKLLEDRMGRNFPKTDYGVLDESLQVITGENSIDKVERRDRARMFAATGFSRSLPEPVKKRQPMIGDELGLDDEEDSESRGSTNFDKGRSVTSVQQRRTRQPADQQAYSFKTKNEVRNGADWLSSMRQTGTQTNRGNSILTRNDVKSAWTRPRAATATAASS